MEQNKKVSTQSPGTRNERSSKQSENADSSASRKASRAGWDFVYLKSDDNAVRLVELRDTEEHCSTVSTVLGVVGFSVPLCLAVPTIILSPRGIPAIVGNIMELGDWDVSGAETMLPVSDISADGYAFFAATVCSTYSEDDEVNFRFALVVPAEAGEGSGGKEIVCWEGRFVRRMSDCTKPGILCLAFGRRDPITRLSELTISTAIEHLQLLVPGWLSSRKHALLLLRLYRLEFSTHNDDLIKLLAASQVEIQLLLDSVSPNLTPNFRGPLAFGGAVVGFDNGIKKSVRFPVASGASFGAEFVQSVPIDANVTLKIAFQFLCDKAASNDPIKAFINLPPISLQGTPPIEDLSSSYDVYILSTDKNAENRAIGRALIRLRCIRYCSRCPDLVIPHALDRCGGPPPTVAHPIRVASMPWKWPVNLSINDGSYFELPVEVSLDGKSLRILTKRTEADGGIKVDLLQDITPISFSFSTLGLPTSDIGLVVRVFSSAASKGIVEFSSIDAVADIILATILCVDVTWLMIAAPDLQLCTALCLKQMRLPVAFVVDSGVKVSSESLDACRHYGVRALVVSAEDATPALITDAVSRDLVIYTHIGVPTLNCPEELKACLEGYFDKGTFAELHRS